MASLTKYLVLVFCVSLFFILGTETRLAPDTPMRQRYQEWLIRYGKQYTTQEETDSRYRIFADNVNRIDAFNAAGDKSYTLGVNQFADQTEDELKTTQRGYSPKQGLRSSSSSSSSSFQYEDVSVSELPSYLDWREKGAVTPVKNQAQCGSCWAFSAVAALEGITKLKTGALVSLSEQELVDCDHDDVYGCRGGWMDQGFQYVQKNGLSTEKNYPYKASDNNCTVKHFQRKATISGYEDVPANSETSLLKAVAHQPVSVAIDSRTFDFNFYEGGIFTGGGCSSSPDSLDHAVTVVGYGEMNEDIDHGKKYWIIKNSWGKGWGEEGYIRFSRDVDQPEGLCGIATSASYPTKHWGRF